MKILILNWRDIRDPQAGGAEVYLHQIGKRLAARHRVHFYCRQYRGSSRTDEIDGLRITRRGGSFSLYLYFIFDYLFSLRREGFDIVVDDINGVPFFTPLFVRRPKVAIIHHIVGREIFFRELPFPLSLVGLVAEKMIPFIYRRTPVVAVSPSTRDELVEFGIGGERIRIIYNAIEHPPPGDTPRAERPTLAYVGRIKAYKQLDHLLQAFAQLLEEVPDAGLVIAGRGDCAELEAQAAGLGISSSVSFMGEVSEQQKIEILDRAWAFVTPSMKEGWGVSVIEANDRGTPAVAYNVPGLRDSIKDGETGLLAAAGDIGSLAQAMSRLLRDGELRQRLSHSAREWALSFSWDSSAQSFAELIGGVISGGRAPGIGNSTHQE